MTTELHVPLHLRKNYSSADEEATIDGAVWLIAHMCDHLGLADLGETEVLDFGCGVRFAQAFLNRALPIKRYVGVDADREMIDFLRESVSDPRFEFVHLDAHNQLYNPAGKPLSERTPLPIDSQQFDLICLFSVFTHLAPNDYVALLKLLRRFAKPDSRLFYTLFIDEQTAGGFGLMDNLPPHDVPAKFVDLDPTKPLLYALYSREHAIELIENTGWEVISTWPPDVHIQHHIICRPVLG